MGAPQNLSSFRCELRIIRAKNIELKYNGHLFVRCYLSAGKKQQGSTRQPRNLIKIQLVLERIALVRMFGAEIPWKTVSETPEMEIEKWAVVVPKSRRVYEDINPPAAQVAMKIIVPTVKEALSVPVPVMPSRKRRNNRRVTNSDECGCMDVGCNCADYDIFALITALDAF
ncbi:hypothetical protein ACSBR2_024403 [Camellia fascicularis]